MKAYLIDPIERSIKEVEYDGNYKSIYKLIDCGTFDLVRFDDGDCVYVDDEGLYKQNPYQLFGFYGYHNPLAGKGLVLGTDAEGNSQSPVMPLEWYKKRLAWIERQTQRLFTIKGAVAGKVDVVTLEALGSKLEKHRVTD